MPETDAFLRAILDNPDDDAPRLIYADWLDEHGDPARAEIIRVQIALARGGEGNAALRAREQELLARHGLEWSAGFDPFGEYEGVIFRRGFVDAVSAFALDLPNRVEELLRRQPVRHLTVRWTRASPEPSGTADHFETGDFDDIYEGLTLGSRQSCPAIRRLAGVRELVRLRSLDVAAGFFGSDGMQALAVCEHLARLESLNLRGNFIGGRGVRALVEAPWLAGLTFLDLSDNEINAAAAHALATGLDALDQAGRLRLRQLRLENNHLRTAGMRVVRGSPVLRRVVRL